MVYAYSSRKSIPQSAQWGTAYLLLMQSMAVTAPNAKAHTSAGKSKRFAFCYACYCTAMTKFLLRDGSLIDVDTEAAPDDVFSYTNTDGITIYAALSEKAEMELLRKVPPTLLSVAQRMQLSDLAA